MSHQRRADGARWDPIAVRTVCFAFFVGLTAVIFWNSLIRLVELSRQYEHYSHIVLIPLISGWLLLVERKTIFAGVRTHWSAGVAAVLGGGLLYWVGHRYFTSASDNDRVSIAIFSVVVVWAGGFALCYGVGALRRGLFPGLFLLLMVPVPDVVLGRAVSWLQTGSAEVSYALFQLVGVPVYRTGFLFALPRVTIEIAQECSGIRSSLALLVVSLLAGHLLLRSPWTKAALTVASLPLLVVKNGIRIVTLTLLSIHVDPEFLTGRLHHRGGLVFFLPILGLLALVLRSLQRLEGRGVNAADRTSGRERTRLPSVAGDHPEVAVELARRD
jgi:exosortase